ncbi:hypothetical protein [Novosphingobium humi]|uniref:Flp pilus assembly protein, pilin Flp n=1 Tax=Novosphingobium humi TaxID=2282397 RepID=A0ABY7TZC8_9SPHN|nr:hypothetical protein [Novosphingobium humi]WCT77891.1 hypothetical protein PQ457_02645 [Novosphingobium humi]
MSDGFQLVRYAMRMTSEAGRGPSQVEIDGFAEIALGAAVVIGAAGLAYFLSQSYVKAEKFPDLNFKGFSLGSKG